MEVDKELQKYLDRSVNVVGLGNGFTIGRETSKDMDFIVIEHNGSPIYKFWHNPKKQASKNPPKHTGGKASYIKIMLKAVQECKDISLESTGFFVKTAGNIQWGNNLLVDKRSKKPLTADDLGKIIGQGKNKTLSIIKELRNANLLIKDKDGYKISTCLIQKGGVNK